MKIALVNDSCERLGVEYISAVLKQSGHTTKLFVDPQLFDDEFVTVKWLSCFFDYKKYLIRDLKEYKPDLVAISVVTGFYQWACTMAKMIKEEMDVPIIFGGIHPTSVPERVIKNDFVDMVCVGEGEYPMLELANSLQKGSIDRSIKNIWFKHNGNIIQNEVRPLIEDLDSLPMPDKDLYYSASPHFSQCYYIMASRGCAYVCSYCCSSYLHELYRDKGKVVRQRSVKSVIEELAVAKCKYNMKTVFFIDDCFVHDIKWLEEFSREYSIKIKIPFSCEMNPQHVSEEVLTCLKSAGCGEIEIGIQSWDKDVRETVFNRKVSDVDMERAMFLIKKFKINLVTGDLLGYPGQKDEHIFKAVQMYSVVKPDRSYIFILKYYPNTLITKRAIRDGFINKVDYERVLDGFYGKYLTRDGNMTDKKVMQFLLLFLLVRFLPKRFIRFILKNKSYRYFPVYFTPALLSIFNNLMTSTMESCLNRRIMLFRYGYFLKKLIQRKTICF